MDISFTGINNLYIGKKAYSKFGTYLGEDRKLKQGKNIAVVSDRGTPVISDPGFILIKNAIKEGFNVVCLPGPTALIPALVMSGFGEGPFTFYGFLNSKEIKRKQELEELKQNKYTIIFYEAPHRIEKTLKYILSQFIL